MSCLYGAGDFGMYDSAHAGVDAVFIILVEIQGLLLKCFSVFIRHDWGLSETCWLKRIW